jgi:hypothetical protein
VSEYSIDPGLLRKTVYQEKFNALARAGVDVSTVHTWDRELNRSRRILVPIDVQAFVVPEHGGEPTVPVGSLVDDPDPFTVGTVRPVGVHLHWAMPDALLKGDPKRSTTALALPTLPDRWVVVRTLLPEGRRTAYATGWVIDAVHGVTVPLGSYSGSIDATDTEELKPLDGARRGSLLWTATYDGAMGRFTLHDPLTDLPQLASVAPQGFHGGRAVYTVAGWWSDNDQDPIGGLSAGPGLTGRLKQLGWFITPDGKDDLDDEPDPKSLRLRNYAGLVSPETSAKVTMTTEYSSTAVAYSNVAPKVRLPVDDVSEVIVGLALPRYFSLLHGSVIGVPIDGTAHGADDRPDPDTISCAIGQDIDDVAAAFAAPGFGFDAQHRQAAERLMAAFTGDLLSRLGTSDGLSDLEGREHSDGFWPLPGKPIPGAKPDRLRTEDTTPMGPTQVGRKGRGARAHDPRVKDDPRLLAKVSWRGGVVPMKHADEDPETKQHLRTQRDEEDQPKKEGGSDAPASRDVVRPAPRMFRPAPVVVGLRNIHPNLRHHGDGLFDDRGLLRVRYPGEATTRIQGTVDGSAVLPTLGNGAIPPEVLRVAREAVVFDGYSWKWLAAAGSRTGVKDEQVEARVIGEMMRIYGSSARYDATGASAVAESKAMGSQASSTDGWQKRSAQKSHGANQVAVELSKFSLADGTLPSPVALTTWRQPWVPLFIEWQVHLEGSEQMAGWVLDGLDLEPRTPGGDFSRTLMGRSPITTGVGKALTLAMTAWLKAEQQRDLTPALSQLSDAQESALGRLAELIAPLDVVSASFDGVGEQLLGIPYVGMIQRAEGTDGKMKPTATALPVPLFGGTLTVQGLRLVDAFGRTLELPTEALATTLSLEVSGNPSAIRMRPRIQPGARLLTRFVDPAFGLGLDQSLVQEAYVDQLRSGLAVTPVSGFLLPDHIDEALEVFDRDGNPLGQVMHDSVTDAVTWETAPGRPLPPDAGPLADIADHAQHAARLAAGLIQKDVDSRHSTDPPSSSTLSAFLRAVDSTLWTVDTYAAVGSATIAGLVGRPIAVVRVNVTLDVPDDVDDLVISSPGGAEGRRAAMASLDPQLFPLRIGELGRSDDSVLGFFVDDDYTTFHVVDRVVASGALSSGRHTGFLGLLGEQPEPDPIVHPYLELEDTLWVRPGQILRLTVLMLPAGKMHVTTGILPRKSLELADEWVTPGLSKVVPSMRVGPLLVDPAEIRLPNVASLGTSQVFTRRTGALTWRDDPILASTTSAYLPKMPHEVQEGWIRVAPEKPEGSAP